MTQDVFDYKFQILMKEWDYTQTHIGRFDTIIFSIRGWAVSAFTAMIAVATTQKIPSLMLLAILPTLLFWLVDALHKTFQRNFISRGNKIERYLRSKNFLDDAKLRSDIRMATPNLSKPFGRGSYLERVKKVIAHALIRNVVVTYVPMIMLCVVVYFLLEYQPQPAG
jgi:hypothetical protein